VSGLIVWKWRTALGVPGDNEGTVGHQAVVSRVNPAKALERAHTPAAIRKQVEVRRGTPVSAETREKLRATSTGRRHTAEARRTIGAAAKARGARPPWLNPPWSAAEDEAVRTKTPGEAAQLTGGTLEAVYNRRTALGVTAARTSGRS
jgi:hypothetical protein